MTFAARNRRFVAPDDKERHVATGPMDRLAVERELQRLKTVRLRLAQDHPFWGFLLLHLRLVPAPELPTFAATDCVRRVFFNPRFTRHLNRDQVAYLLCHEAGHALFETGPRQGRRDPELWNCATDYAINRVVDAMAAGSHPLRRIRRPEGVFAEVGEVRILADRRFDGLIAEAIYEHLLRERPVLATATVKIQLPGDDDGGGGGTIEVEVVGHVEGGLDVHLPVELSEAERDELADRIAGAIEAHSMSEQRGHLPGDALRNLGHIRVSRVPWQRVLHRFAGEALAPDQYSLRRPNKRYLAYDIVVPGLVADGPARLVVAVDTSASMDATALAMAVAEIAALAALVSEVTVLIGDARVHDVVPTHRLAEFIKQPRFRGGGGTDHRPVFAWLDAQPRRPDLFIGITDLWSRFPDRKPTYPVLWLAPTRHGQAPWGEVVQVR